MTNEYIHDHHLTKDEEQEAIITDEYEPPCDEYDPAGIGGGLAWDGQVYCAMCGWSRSAHRERVRIRIGAW